MARHKGDAIFGVNSPERWDYCLFFRHKWAAKRPCKIRVATRFRDVLNEGKKRKKIHGPANAGLVDNIAVARIHGTRRDNATTATAVKHVVAFTRGARARVRSYITRKQVGTCVYNSRIQTRRKSRREIISGHSVSRANTTGGLSGTIFRYKHTPSARLPCGCYWHFGCASGHENVMYARCSPMTEWKKKRYSSLSLSLSRRDRGTGPPAGGRWYRP